MTNPDTTSAVLPAAGELARNDVLVAAPTGDALRGIPERVLAAAAEPDDGAVVVSTRYPGTVVRERFGEATSLAPGRIGVVDCTPEGDEHHRNGDGLVWRVNSPGDLTGSGIALDECRSALADRGVDRVHVAFDTLSTLLVSLDHDTVLQYVHHLTAGVGPPNGTGVYPVRTEPLDDRELAMLEHLFDGVVEVRRGDDGRELRRRGFGVPPSDWRPVGEARADPGTTVSD